MYRKLLLSAIFAILALSDTGSGQARYDTYANARFGYSISYPGSVLRPQPEADNGDGRLFTARDGSAELRVWGMYNALFDTLRKAYRSDLRERGSGVTYKSLQKNGYVISGVKGDRIYYQKTILKGKDGDAGAVFSTFNLEYATADKAKFDPVVRRISASFRFD